MSTHGAHGHTHTHTHTARLAQLRDPTHTERLRERFRRDLRGRFRDVRGAIRAAVGYERDVFALRQDAGLAEAPDEVERFATDEAKTQAFLRWLGQAIANDVLEPMDRRAVREGEHWTAAYVRGAYGQGWEQAVKRLRQAGAEPVTVDDVFNRPVALRTLRRLYTRAYENLQSVTQATAPAVRDVLTTGLAEGVNPRELARRLTSEIRSLERTRAEVLARTEVINAHAEATLDRYERAGTDGVTVSGEFATADDARVCPICEAIEGETFAPGAMRTATFTFDPSASEPDHLAGEYAVKPPVHPNCRCAILPVLD